MKDMAESEPREGPVYAIHPRRQQQQRHSVSPAAQRQQQQQQQQPMSPTTVEGAGDAPYPPGVAENGYSEEDSMDGSYNDAPLDFSMKGPRRDSDNGDVSESGTYSDGNEVFAGDRERDRRGSGGSSSSNGSHSFQNHHQDGLNNNNNNTPGVNGMRLDTMVPVIKQEPGLPVREEEDPHEHDTDEEHLRSPVAKIGEPRLALPGTVMGLPNGMLGSFPFMLDPARANGAAERQQGTNNNKGGGGSTRPFKAYPKDPLSIPLGGYLGMPGVLPFAGLDPAAAAAAASAAMGMAGSEELLHQYRMYAAAGKGQEDALRKAITQQQQHLHLQQQQMSASGNLPALMNSLKSSTTSDASSLTPSTSPPGIPPSPSSSLSPVSPVLHPGGGHRGHHHPAPRKRPRSLPDEQKDEAYWERRRKNNEAAKRSRDARRAKEDEIAIRAAFLEQENLKLRVEVAALKNETAKLRCMLYNS